jgi:acyl-CoA synthetase (AMP-forming)/AMP-acid ligase II
MDGLHRFLTRSAERAPEHPAYVKEGQATSYGALEASARRFAGGLRKLGVAAGDRVALLLDSDVQYLVAYYGVLKAGAVVVPLANDTRPAPLARALAHSGARAIVVAAAAASLLPNDAALVPALELVITHGPSDAKGAVELGALLGGTDELDDGAGGDALAALVYTSGTTGTPKGVMLSHAALAANTQAIVRYLELGPADRIGMVLPYYYSYGTSVLNTHVAAGATVVELGGMTYPVDVLRALADSRSTGFSGVPATFARLVGAMRDFSGDLSALRYLTQAGARMSPELAQEVRAAFPRARLFVMYGQTEAAARLTYLEPELFDEKPGSVGRPLEGGHISIRDSEGRELKAGEVGEVVARGPNLMLGYYRDPEGTARALGPDGLRTGDLGYLDDDGCLFLTGRANELIKSGAHRISPLEIEEVLDRVPGIAESGVCGVPDALLGEAILGYVVPRPGEKLEKRRILAACFEELPRFKLPKYLRVAKELPRTSSGKLRRGELAEWFARGEGEAL